MTDLRLEPKQRKNAALWQYYLWWRELVEMRKKHLLRIASAERGKSVMDTTIEREMIASLDLDIHIKPKNKAERDKSLFTLMTEEGQKVGQIWNWCLSHKGIGESLAAQILAQIDDISNFDTIAKLWRYAGYGINFYWVDEKGKAICPKDGWKWVTHNNNRYRVWTIVTDEYVDLSQVENKIAIPQNIEAELIERVDVINPNPEWQLKEISDRLCAGYHSPYNTPLKSILWNLMDGFVKQQTPYYVDLYYSEKDRLTKKHPDKTKGHVDNMAKRKVKKEFLKQLWLNWRQFEGLPVSEEY